MRTFKALRGVVVAAGIAVGLLMVVASGAMAAGIKICVPSKEGKSITTPKKGACAAGDTTTTLLPQAEQEKLEQLLPYERYVASGVGGKPTIQIEGANLQVLSKQIPQRSGEEGTGNLIVGRDEEQIRGEWEGELVTASRQTGSDNLIIGNEQAFHSYDGFVGGYANTDSAPYSDVFGYKNTASALYSSVTGGGENEAISEFASVSGGKGNRAKAVYGSVSGGDLNQAKNPYSSVSGGYENRAEGEYASVSGGSGNRSKIVAASVSGGFDNQAEGEDSSVSGGSHNVTGSKYDSVSGGANNKTEDTSFSDGLANWIGGGEGNRASGLYGSLVGGHGNLTYTGEAGTIVGGTGNQVIQENFVIEGKFVEGGHFDSIFGGKGVTLDGNSETNA